MSSEKIRRIRAEGRRGGKGYSHEQREVIRDACVEAFERTGSYREAGRELDVSHMYVRRWIKIGNWRQDLGLSRALQIGVDMRMPRRYLVALAHELDDKAMRDRWLKRLHEGDDDG